MSSDIIPVLVDSDPFLLTKTTLHHLVGNVPNPTLEVVAKMLRHAAPPEKVKMAFVLFNQETFDARQRLVKALENEGYTNIEAFDPRSVELSSCIFGLPLNCAIGEPVFVNGTTNYVDPFNRYLMCVIQKRENGWQIINAVQHPDTALSEYPSARNVVIRKGASKAIEEEVRKLFPGLKLHLCDLTQPAAHLKYLLNRANNGILNGYEVLPFCKVQLTVEFTNKRQNLALTDRVPPFTVEKEIDIADAPIVTIYACCDTDDGLTVLKTFKLKTKAFRKVLITVNVDKTLIPAVTMKTASTYKPRDRLTPVIYAVRRLPEMYTMTAIFEDHVADEGVFSATSDVFTHIVRSSAIPAIKGIFFIHDHKNTMHQFQEFRDFCANAKVFPALEFIPNDSTTLSFILDRAGFSIKPGQTITVLTPKKAFVVQRDGHFLQVLHECKPENYNINEHNVGTVIIENNENTYTQTDLEHLRLKYYPKAVIIVPGVDFLNQPLPKFFWSRVNGTDYGGNLFSNFTNFEFVIEGGGFETVKTRFKAIPYIVTADIAVGDAKMIKVIKFLCACHIDAYQAFDVPIGAKAVRFTISVESVCDITITMSVIDETEIKRQPEELKAIESHSLDAGLSQLNLDTPSSTVFTFTADNRVLVEAGETYTGDKEFPAYVRLQSGKAPDVGQKAFDALKKHPGSVFYDVTRLLAADFDPDHPDPSWGFKTTRDSDGKLLVHGDDGVVTFPLVLFGMIVKCIQNYIKEHLKSDVPLLGIRLPAGCVISDADLKTVSPLIGVELILLS